MHWEITKLSTKLSQDFAEDITQKDLDWFIKSAENLAETAFQKVDIYFLRIFQKYGFLQFQEPQIKIHTRPHTGRWLLVYNSALQTYQSINDETQQMREYRELRKDSRGQVIGGGFGFTGAIKGMVAAGAVNLVTGTLHSLANSMGNTVEAFVNGKIKCTKKRHGKDTDPRHKGGQISPQSIPLRSQAAIW